MHFSDHIIEQIKNKIKLSDIVGKKVKLQRKGNEFSGLCPFHNEKTPSFTVNDDKQFYHCFGCAAHGDIFKFVTDTTGVSFKEALDQLAAQAGIVIKNNNQTFDHNKKYYQLMESAANWFAHQLRLPKNDHALTYLINRNLDLGVIEKFSIGFAPLERTSLKDYLKSQGATYEELLELGLVIKTDSGEYFDRFRGRIIFPIVNISGKVIAFGGRSLDNKIQPKYLNSPETILFKKREVLFAENIAKQASYQKKRLIVVEGYMDVVAMHSAGFTETVASLGTAISKENLEKLWKYVNCPIICLDGDEAGLRAMNKLALESLSMIQQDCSLDFIKLPSGNDPDSLIKNQGKAAMEKLIENKISLSNMIWSLESSVITNRSTPEQKSSLEKKLFDIANTIKDKVVRSFYRSYFSEQLWKNIKKYKNERLLKNNKSIISNLSSVANCIISDLEKIERTLIIIMINYPVLLSDHIIEEEFSMIEFSDHRLDYLRSHLLNLFFENKDLSKQELYFSLENDLIFTDITSWGEFNIPLITDYRTTWEYSLSKHRILLLEQEYKSSLEELTETSIIKAQEIRKQIISQRNNMLNIEQLTDS